MKDSTKRSFLKRKAVGMEVLPVATAVAHLIRNVRNRPGRYLLFRIFFFFFSSSDFWN